MGWSNYGNGAGNCKSDASGTVFFQDLAAILHELTGAASERMDLLSDASTPFTTAAGGSVAALSLANIEGMSRAQIKTNMTALKTMITSLINTARMFSSPYCHFVGPDLALSGISGLLGQGSYGTNWLASANIILSGDAWNQIRECFDNLTKIRWKATVSFGEWTSLSSFYWEELDETPYGLDLSGATYMLNVSRTAPVEPYWHQYWWNARDVIASPDSYQGTPIKMTSTVLVEYVNYIENTVVLSIGAVGLVSEMTGDALTISTSPGSDPFVTWGAFLEVTPLLSVLYSDVSGLLTYKGD